MSVDRQTARDKRVRTEEPDEEQGIAKACVHLVLWQDEDSSS